MAHMRRTHRRLDTYVYPLLAERPPAIALRRQVCSVVLSPQFAFR